MLIKQSDKMSPSGLADALRAGAMIEGKAKIILKDEQTGKTEMIEHKNLVTNAVNRIYGKNFMSNADISTLLPLEKMLSGILCFKDAFTNPSANDIYCPNEDEISMTACAGDEAHSTLNPYRGNPNAIASSSSFNSFTKVWEWQTLQGNGKIGSLALTSGVCGNMGLKPIEGETLSPIDTVSNLSSNAFMFADENTQNTGNSWTVKAASRRPLWIDVTNPRYGYSVAVEYNSSLETCNLYILKVEHVFLCTSLQTEAGEYQEVERHTILENVPTSNDLRQYIICDDDDYVYLVRVFSMVQSGDESEIRGVATFVKQYKISKSTFEMTSATYKIQENLCRFFANLYSKTYTDIIANLNIYGSLSSAPWLAINGLPFDDGMIPVYASIQAWTGSGTESLFNGMIWVKVTRDALSSDFELIDSTIVGNPANPNGVFTMKSAPNRGSQFWSPNTVKLGRRLYLMNDEYQAYLLNGSKFYHCGLPSRPNGHSSDAFDPDGIVYSPENCYPAMMFSSFSPLAKRYTRSGFCYSNFYLATINNLEEQVEKTPTMSMRIEYSMTVL